ncbi:hypothetical protein D9M73_149040 [compost metagenome]
MQVRPGVAPDTGHLSRSLCHEPFFVPADRADLGHHLDCLEMATGRGGHSRVDRLSLRPRRAGAVRDPAAQPTPASDEPSRASDLPGSRLVPVLRQLHVLPHREPVDPQRSGGRGVFHRHPMECPQRAGVLRSENRPQRADGRCAGPAWAGPSVLAGTGRAYRQSGNLARPWSGPVRHLVFLGGQHALKPATEGRSQAADHQCLGHGLRGGDALGVVSGQRHSLRPGNERALYRLTVVPGDSRVGDRFHRLPDAGRPHGAGTCCLLHCAVPCGGAKCLGVRRGLPVDRSGNGGAGDGHVG